MSLVRRATLLVLFLLQVLILQAQSIQVSLSVPPPYPIYLEDYLEFRARTIVTVTNMTGQTQQIKLLTRVESSDGRISARTKPSFVPATPIVLGPNETRVLQGEQLRSINANLTLNDIDHQGLDPRQIARTGTLPEGNYQLCMTAYSYPSGQALSGPMAGCAMLQLSHYDPPIILQPQSASDQVATQPQFLNFVWTPAGLAGKTRYNLRLVDMTASGLFNPNDAFSGKVIPFFDRSGLIANSYAYGMADLPLLENHQYAVEVVAYDPTQSTSFRNNGRSAVTTFTWRKRDLSGGPTGPGGLADKPGSDTGPGKEGPGAFDLTDKPAPKPEPPNGACVSTTQYSGPIGQTIRQTIVNGTDIQVGFFVMRNTVFTKSTGGSFNGTGTIRLPFLNLNAEVEFTGIQVDATDVFKAGKITAKVSSKQLIDDGMAKVRDGVMESLPDAQGLYNELMKAQNFVSQLNPDLPRVLPVSWDGGNYPVGVVGLIFEPTRAYLNAVLPVDVPQAINGEWLTLSAKGIAIQPNGFDKASIRIGLAKDVTLPLSNQVSMLFKGGAEGSHALVDCQGFHSLQISGAMVLSREIALPLDPQYKVITDNKVNVSVPFEIDAALHLEDLLVAGLGFSHPFAVPDARDIVLQGGATVLDFSSSRNSALFNQAYPGKTSDWIGLYMQELSILLPEGFKKDGGGRISVSAKELMVDKMGVSLQAFAQGKPLAKGELAGWGFSLDTLQLALQNSLLTGGGLGGSIRLPLGEKAHFGFFAAILKGDQQGANFNFELSTGSELDADLFLAKIKLQDGSKIHIHRVDGKFEAATELHGEISVGFSEKKPNSNVGKMDIPSLQFQELVINGKDKPGFVPEIKLGFAALASMQGIQAKIGDAFELGLTKLEFLTDKQGGSNRAGLSLGLGVSLFGGGKDEPNAIGASGGFTLWAKYDAAKKTYVYDQAKLDALAVAADVGAAYVSGSIEIFDQDATFGNGFRGGVKAEIRGINAGVDVNMQFGRTLPNKGNFKYWYFDAMVELPDPGLNIPSTPASLYGFGGGAWCNMERSGGIGNKALQPGQYNPKPKGGAAPTVSGATFTPANGKGGFKASVILGLTGKKEAFNADVTFSMAFDAKKMSVDDIRLEGNGYVMQGLDVMPRNPESARVYCLVELGVNIPTRTFGGAFAVEAKAGGSFQGSGAASILFQLPPRDAQGKPIPTEGLKWHVKLGWWTPGFDPFNDPTRLKAIMGFENMLAEYNLKFQGYFMAGNDLQDGLPPLPSYIYDVCSGLGAEKKKNLPPQAQSAQNLAFALGAGLQFNAGFDFKVLYADLQAEAAFDVLISDLNATCDGKEIGFNGWYAQGQAYAYVFGEAGLFLIPLVELAAGAVLEIKTPNPTWVRGTFAAYIKTLGVEAGKYEGTFERGSKCSVQTDMDPFEGIKLITAVKPGNKEKSVDPMSPDISVTFKYRIGELIPIYNPYLGADELYQLQGTVKLTDSKGKVIPIKNKSLFFQSLATLEPLEHLLPQTEYRIVAEASINKGKEEKVKEVLIASFTTADMPSAFGLQDLVESYPNPGQRYAMREAQNGGPATGMLKMKQDLCFLVNPQGTRTVATFTELSTGKVYESACDCVGSKQGIVRFDLPVGLKPETIYTLRLLNKPEDKPGQGGPGLQIKANVQTVLFDGLHFRTSKYRNLKEKMATYKVVKTAYVPAGVSYAYNVYGQQHQNGHNFHIPVVLMEGGEPLDRYEMESYSVQDGQGNSHQGGKLVREWGSIPPWRDQMIQKYVDFSTLKKAERDLLLTYGKNKQVNRPAGFPFYGSSNRPMKHTLSSEVFSVILQTATYEGILRSQGYLSGQESLASPEPTLSQAEIQAAGAGGFQGGKPLFINNQGGGNQGGGFQGPGGFGIQQGGGGPKKLVPFMDVLPLLVNQDKWLYDKIILQAALGGGQFPQAYAAIKGLGWPEYPKGAKTFQFGLREYRRINGWQQDLHGTYGYTTTK